MARHDQKTNRRHMVCKQCEEGRCEECVDVLRAIYSNNLICKCTRRGHAGEPRDKQIMDPETGTVYAPGLEVSIDGEVKRRA
jgi:hypothetical protein